MTIAAMGQNNDNETVRKHMWTVLCRYKHMLIEQVGFRD